MVYSRTWPREAGRGKGSRHPVEPSQLTAVEAMVAGHGVLVVQPTGAGTSAVCQVPALLPARTPGCRRR